MIFQGGGPDPLSPPPLDLPMQVCDLSKLMATYIVNSFLACGLLITIANSLDPIRTNKMSILIWIQPVNTDSVPERIEKGQVWYLIVSFPDLSHLS